jgi:hypothetical protein
VSGGAVQVANRRNMEGEIPKLVTVKGADSFDAQMPKRHTEFRRELEDLINRKTMEAGSNTPDFILADFLVASLKAFDAAIDAREKWYGRIR